MAERSGSGLPGEAPWWSSRPPASSPRPSTPSLADLATGVQAVLSWAREQVLAPHAEHVDPQEHAQCLACRGQVVLGGLLGSTPGMVPEPEERAVREEVKWIELDPPRA